MIEMRDIQYGDVSQLHWLWLVAACGIVVVIAAAARRRALRRFATADALPRLLPARRPLDRLARGGLVTVAMAMLVLALVDVRWGKVRREVPQRGIEVMFVLDVSRSMLAEDATPNRLRRAKQQILDMVDAIAGDRIGLVVFAGEARRHVPLTSHYADFKQALADVGPYDTYRGGSRLGEAIEAAADGFLDKTAGHKAIVLLSDGEDQGSEPVEVARRVYQQRGIHVFTIGLGDRGQGARIPTGSPGRSGFVRHEGEVVWTRLEEDILREVAEQSDGAYVPAGTKQVDMAGVYRRHISPIQAREFAMAEIDAYQARFQWLLAPAVILLLLEMLVATWPRQSAITGPGAGRATAPGAGRAGAAVALSVLLGAGAAAQPLERAAAERLGRANRWLEQGELERAAAEYQRLAASHPEHPAVLYNRAVALYRQGKLDEAARLFQQVASARDPGLAARAHYNLGNTAYRAALAAAEQEPEAAIGRLESAIEHYRRAIRLDGQDDAARVNLELAGRLIDQLQQQLDEQSAAGQEPGEQQTSEGPDQPDESEQASDPDQPPQGDEQQGQRQQQERSEPPEEQSGQPGEDQQEQQPSAAGQEDAQQPASESRSGEGESPVEQQTPGAVQQPEDRTQPEGEPSPSADRPPDDSQPPGDSQQPDDSQQPGDSQQLDSDAPPTESPNQPDSGAPEDPDESPRGAGEGGSGEQEAEPPSGPLTASQDRSEPGGTAGDPPPGAERLAPMTPQEAQKMLQAIRDRDLLRRLQLQQEKRSRRVPVEKDW